MAGGALEPFYVALDLHHGHVAFTTQLVPPPPEIWNDVLRATGAVDDHFVTAANRIPEWIASGGKDVAVLSVVERPATHGFGWFGRRPTRL